MTPLTTLAPEEYASDREVRWCPGCGDYSILAQLKAALAAAELPRERVVFVSGSGCSSRLPYYLSTYGFQTLHGRGPAVATGLKAARPDLSVWVITGDGDGLGIGLSHLLHTLRRNVDVKILLFNNEVLGLTKGQTSPTSRPGTRTKTDPDGSCDPPLRPIPMALAAGATFAARTIDVDAAHLTETLLRAAAHRGTAFVEVLQNCNVYNDGAWEYATDKAVKDDRVLYLRHGRPLVFGKDRTRGLRLNRVAPEAVTLNGQITEADLPTHDETAADATLTTILSRMSGAGLPECFGVFRAVQLPTFEDAVRGRAPGGGDLAALLAGDDGWTAGG